MAEDRADERPRRAQTTQTTFFVRHIPDEIPLAKRRSTAMYNLRGNQYKDTRKESRKSARKESRSERMEAIAT